MQNKRYYWLKLMEDFFRNARIKKLRKIAGGDTYVVIYLKLMLLTINNQGKVEYEAFEQSIEDEIALKIDEDEDNVRVVFAFLLANHLCVKIDKNTYKLTEVEKVTGSETASTQRSQKSRAMQKLLQCNTDAITCNVEKEKEKEKEIYIDEEERKQIEKTILNYSINELEFDFIVEDFISFLTINDKSKIDNRYTYAAKLKSQLLSGDKRTLLNFISFLKNKEVVDFQRIKNAKHK